MIEDEITSGDLLEQADEVFQKRDYEAALPIYQQAAQTAYNEFNRSVETEALSQLARCFLGLSRKEDGRAYLEKAAAKADEADKMGWSRFLSVRGRFEWKDGNLAAARKTFDDLYTYCELSDLWGRAIDAANMMAIVSETTDEQIEWSRKGIQAAQDGEQDQWLGPLWNNLGATYFDMEQYETALVCFEQAREYHWQYSEEVSKLYADYHVGMTLRHLGRYEEAATWLRPVLAWAERLGNEYCVAQACEDLGEAMIGLGKKEAGVALVRRALEIHQRGGLREVNPTMMEALEKRVEELEG